VTRPRLVRAAGCIVWRYGSKEPEVVLVHRPRLQDWSFPKGKLDPGESPLAGAVREVQEETGLSVSVGPRLPDQHYVVNGGTPKVVYYWAAEAPKTADLTAYPPNSEIDKVRWFGLSKARKRLTYPHDADLLDVFATSAFDTRPLLIVRHAHARSRRTWRGDDSERPLKADGIRQAERLVSLLSAYGVTRLVSSDAVRCVDTVLPYANSRPKVRLTLDSAVAEDSVDKLRLRRRIRKLAAGDKRVAVCSHRPVLPLIFETLGIEPMSLEPGALVVVHRKEGNVFGTEVHPS
jgi:8-oxo-dGTP pyrophosphatase MutT (NUDIX family)/phosphohistidine phosphatase SixA